MSTTLPPGQDARNHADRLAVGAADVGISAELADASVECRPVFPWRPVALVLGIGDDPAGWADAVGLVDDLQELDVDARLALPSLPATASRFVQPARASETTLRNLRPDVVVAWDRDAVAAAERWSAGMRSLMVVELAGDGTEVTPVAWRIGVAQGRLRGRFGRKAAASDLAPLLRRLAAGPQAEAPDPQVVIGQTRRPWDRVDPSIGVHRRPPRRSCVYVLGAVSAESERAARSLAGHLRRANVDLEVARPEHLPSSATSVDFVILHGVTRHAAVQGLAGRRRDRPTVVHLDESDLDAAGRLAPVAAALVVQCGCSVASTAEGLAILRDADVGTPPRAITVPPLMAADRYEDLARAQADRNPPPLEVIGWAPSDGAEPSAWDRSVEVALRGILDERPAARVDVLRGDAHLIDHPGVRRLRHEVQPHSGGRWALFIASDASRAPLHIGPMLMAEVGVLGVPTLVPEGGWTIEPGRVEVTAPDRPESWATAITAILDDGSARERLAFGAVAAAGSLHRPSAADAVVNRFLGWIDGGPR